MGGSVVSCRCTQAPSSLGCICKTQPWRISLRSSCVGAPGDTPPPFKPYPLPPALTLSPPPLLPKAVSARCYAPSGLICRLPPARYRGTAIRRGIAPSSAGGFPEPPPACGCAGYRFHLRGLFITLPRAFSRPSGSAPTDAASSGALPRRAPSKGSGGPASPPRLPRSLRSRPRRVAGATGERLSGLGYALPLPFFVGFRRRWRFRAAASLRSAAPLWLPPPATAGTGGNSISRDKIYRAILYRTTDDFVFEIKLPNDRLSVFVCSAHIVLTRPRSGLRPHSTPFLRGLRPNAPECIIKRGLFMPRGGIKTGSFS